MDDWQVGDLALCVKRDPWRNATTIRKGGPKSGQIFIVEITYPAADDGTLILAFAEYPFEGFGARHFRKIRPLTDDERASFLADLDAPVQPEPVGSQAVVTAHSQHGGHPIPVQIAAHASASISQGR